MTFLDARPSFSRAMPLLALATMLTGCPAPISTCVPGATSPCLCIGGGSGVQSCTASGTYTMCVCAGPDAGDRDAAVGDASVDGGRDAGGNDAAGLDGSTVDAATSDADLPDAGLDAAATPDAAPTLHTLSVSRGGTGSGTVNTTDGLIACGAACSASYLEGVDAILQAVPDAGSMFVGWTGVAECSTGTGDCAIHMTSDRTAMATFERIPYDLTVSKLGTGQGLVTSTPAGINCGSDCTETYLSGTTVMLTASPAIGSTFDGWSGACSGTGACLVDVTAPATVSASFTLMTHTLTVTRTGTLPGTVTSSPAGISCGTDCSQDYSHGTTVMLMVAPGGVGTFTGWSGGGCSGMGSCVVTMTAATTVNAAFGP